jgi:hypothetical protein
MPRLMMTITAKLKWESNHTQELQVLFKTKNFITLVSQVPTPWDPDIVHYMYIQITPPLAIRSQPDLTVVAYFIIR